MTFQIPREEGLALRQKYLDAARRVVVKVGSALLTSQEGIDRTALANIAETVFALCESGREVILVSSGAVAAGKQRLGGMGQNIGLKEKQAVAAVGQSSLMRSYEDTFNRYDKKVAQILLTHSDFAKRDRYLNVRNTIFTLLSWNVLPVINENDTVSVQELRFGDNDTLGAMVTNLIEADIFVCLTDVDGLYSGNPATDPEAQLVCSVARVDKAVEKMAGNVVGALGTGGMRSKILAAKMASARGVCSFIGSGRTPGILQKLFAGEPVGSFFLPQEEKMQSRKHWIAYTLRPKGSIVLDDGACRAVVKNGKSLLPSGIVAVQGKFSIGDPVQCLDGKGKSIASGLVNYSSAAIAKIKGVQTSEIEKALGYKDSDEVIHRDNLVLL